MSTKQTYSPATRLFESPQAVIMSAFFAVVLGTSLVEFNETLFPPKITSLNFWALLPVYYGAFSTWFGTVTLSRGRTYPDTYLSKIWLTLMIMVLVSYLALLFFASRAADSLLSYMWGWIAVFIAYWTNYYFRYLDLHLPEPLSLCAIFGLLALANAVAYSIWTVLFPPVPVTVNWVFVFIAFAVILSYRQMLRARQAWQPTPTN